MLDMILLMNYILIFYVEHDIIDDSRDMVIIDVGYDIIDELHYDFLCRI